MTQSSNTGTAIVETVAEYEDTSLQDLPSLEDWIDADTARKLLSDRSTWTEPLEFTYLWYHVTVSPTGEVTITP